MTNSMFWFCKRSGVITDTAKGVTITAAIIGTEAHYEFEC